MMKTSVACIALMTMMCLSNFAAAGLIGFEGDTSIYSDGITDWQVVEMYAKFDTNGTQVLSIIYSEVKTSDSQGFNHNDTSDNGNWLPSFSQDISGVSDPNRDSYVTIGYGVGALASSNKTVLLNWGGPGTGPFVPSEAGWYNDDLSTPQFANPRLKIGQFVWELSRNASFSFSADIVYTNPNSTAGLEGKGSFSFSGSSSSGAVPEPSTAITMGLLGIVGFAGNRRRRRTALNV